MHENELGKKEKRTLMIVSLVLVLTLVLGISYAYFAFKGQSGQNTITTANMALQFDDGTSTLNAANIRPLIREVALPTQDSTGKVTKVGKAVTKNFKITNTGDNKMYIHLTLDNMTLPDNLRRYDFVWSLYEVLDSTNKIEKNVSNGTFLIEENNMDIAPYQVFEADETKEYNLYIWIEETYLDQNVMMGQTFKATITATGEEYWTSPESDFVVDSNGVLTEYNGPGGDVIIPPTVNGITVKEIYGEEIRDFDDSTNVLNIYYTGVFIGYDYETEEIKSNLLTSIVIPNTVTKIGDGAFSGNKLTSVFIPNSVVTIGGGAFQSNQLTKLFIPNSVIKIGDMAFSGVSGESLETIVYFHNLKTVFIPNSVVTIGEGAFGGNQLENIIIPNSVVTIGSSAFGFNKLTIVVIPESVTTIDGIPFVLNQNLTQFIILGKSEVPKYDDENYTGFYSGWNVVSVGEDGNPVLADIIFRSNY